jgi:amidase
MSMEAGAYVPSFMRFTVYVLGLYKDTVFPLSYKKYLTVLTRRDSLIATLEEFLSTYDVWLCPVAITTAYKHIVPKRLVGPFPVYKKEMVVDGESVAYLTANGAYATIFNITGNPVVVMPIGYTDAGIPIGVQVVGARWQDARLLTVAEQLFKAGGAFRHPLGYQ